MKKSYFIFLCVIFFTACSATKNVFKNDVKTLSKADLIVANALAYEGVKYKFGGTTLKGMDCSGVVFVAFGEGNIQLPRVSRNMANEGEEIALKNVKKGDLLFFITDRNSTRINHVGLITSVENGEVLFIHSTTSKGVIVSSLSEKYWENAFVKATTIL